MEILSNWVLESLNDDFINFLMTNNIILFDGVCNLCNSFVNFIIEKDDKNIFKFAAIQSLVGQKLLSQLRLNPFNLYSIILIDNNTYYEESTAILKIIKNFNGFWKLFYTLIIIPPFIRNIIYKVFVVNRYKWFGKRDKCRTPSPEFKNRFL